MISIARLSLREQLRSVSLPISYLFITAFVQHRLMSGQGAETRAGRGGFQAGKDSQPQVTTAELGVIVGQSFDKLIEAIQTGRTDRLTSYLAFASHFHRYSRRN